MKKANWRELCAQIYNEKVKREREEEIVWKAITCLCNVQYPGTGECAFNNFTNSNGSLKCVRKTHGAHQSN